MDAFDPTFLKWDSIQKLKYRAKAGISAAERELNYRLEDRLELPLPGIRGETLYLTGYGALRKRADDLIIMLQKLPNRRGVQDIILLDAWSSATIEGARTTVEQVRRSFSDPKTKDDRMVINGITAANYAYSHLITERNIRKLWEMVVDGVCDNAGCRGYLYRDGDVYIGSETQRIHVPASYESIPDYMSKWFAYVGEKGDDLLIRSFVAHFYFVYIHPFCDGNGRLTRILNASCLYHGGYKKVKSLSITGAINRRLHGYYNTLEESENIMVDGDVRWLDLSPFVAYMMDVFEGAVIDGALAKNVLTDRERRILDRMNQIGIHAEITARKAAGMLEVSEASARGTLNALVQKGYLVVNTSQLPFIYRLQQHITE